MATLTNDQKRVLGSLAALAFARLESLDLLDLPSEVQTCSRSRRMEFWRQRECAAVTGHASFRDCDRRTDYLPLKGRYEALAGESGRAFTTELRAIQAKAAHAPPGCDYLRQIWEAAARAGLHRSYVEKIARTKDIEGLSLKRLENLRNTMRNRANAKLGVGSTAARNKKQREAGK